MMMTSCELSSIAIIVTETEMEGRSPRSPIDDLSGHVKPSRDPRPSSSQPSRQQLRRSKSVGFELKSHRKTKRSSDNVLQSSLHGCKGSIENRDPLPPESRKSDKEAKSRRDRDCDLSSHTRSRDRKSTRTEASHRKRITSTSLTGRDQGSRLEDESESAIRASTGTRRDPRRTEESPKISRSSGSQHSRTTEEPPQRSASARRNQKSPNRDRKNCMSSSSHRDKRSRPAKRSHRLNSDASPPRKGRNKTSSSSQDELSIGCSSGYNTDGPSKRSASTKRGQRSCLSLSLHRDKRSSSTRQSCRRDSDTSVVQNEGDNSVSPKSDALGMASSSDHSNKFSTMDRSRSRRSRSSKRSSRSNADLDCSGSPRVSRLHRSKSLNCSKSEALSQGIEVWRQTETSGGSAGYEIAVLLRESEQSTSEVGFRSGRPSGSVKRSQSSILCEERASSSDKEAISHEASRHHSTASLQGSLRSSKSVEAGSRRSHKPKQGDSVERSRKSDSRHRKQKSQKVDSSMSGDEDRRGRSHQSTKGNQPRRASENSPVRELEKGSITDEVGAHDGYRSSGSSKALPDPELDGSRNHKSSNRRFSPRNNQCSKGNQTGPHGNDHGHSSRQSLKGNSRHTRGGTDQLSDKEERRRAPRDSRTSHSFSTEATSESKISRDYHPTLSRDKRVRAYTAEAPTDDSERYTRNSAENLISTAVSGFGAINFEEALAKCTARFEESSASDDDSVPSRDLSSAPNFAMACEPTPGGHNKRTRTWARSKLAGNEQRVSKWTEQERDEEQEVAIPRDEIKSEGEAEAEETSAARIQQECGVQVPVLVESDGETFGIECCSDFYLTDSDESQEHENTETIEDQSHAVVATAPKCESHSTDEDTASETTCMTTSLDNRGPIAAPAITTREEASLPDPYKNTGNDEAPEEKVGELCSDGDEGPLEHNRRPSERSVSLSSNGSCPLSRGNVRRTQSSKPNLTEKANLATKDCTDFHSEWGKSEDPVQNAKQVQFREDVANSNGVACSCLEPDMELSEEDIETMWYSGQNYKDFRNFCIKETISARENNSYTSRFNLVWATCDTESTSASWQDLMTAPHTKEAPNNAVMLAKARYRGFEREVFSSVLVRYRKFAIKYVVRKYRSIRDSDVSDSGADTLLREASEKCSEPFRRYARLIAEGDGLLVAAWEGAAQQSRRKLERTYSGLSAISESYMVTGEAEDPADERKDLLQSLKSSGSCRHLMSQKKVFDNPALRRGDA